MAAAALPEPGTEFGPCEDQNCGHTDCAQTRAMAAVICPDCSEPIGYDRRFFQDVDEGEQADWTRLAHELCVIRRHEAAKADR